MTTEMVKQVKPLVNTVDTFFLLTEPASTNSSPRYKRVTRRPHTTVRVEGWSSLVITHGLWKGY